MLPKATSPQMKPVSQILHGRDLAELKVAPINSAWKLGYFVNPPHPFHNEGFELKWSHTLGGQSKPGGAGKNITAYTLTILIRGKFKISFPDMAEEYIMTKEGEYLYFPPGVSHDWVCVEDALTVTLRWPSVKGDQIKP